jgi:RimJ/RimL family protein N-acetyltransferase
MFIRSERLFLRPAWPEDAQELHAAINDERVVRNLARAPWPYTLDDARAFLEGPQDRCYPALLVTLPSARGSRLLGGIGLHEEGGRPELGYWLTPEAWGHGYATEAASAVLRVARTLGHARVGARHFVDNPASGRVLEKVGFRRTGEVTERHSAGRGQVARSFVYELRFGRAGDCDSDPPAGDGCAFGKRAA